MPLRGVVRIMSEYVLRCERCGKPLDSGERGRVRFDAETRPGILVICFGCKNDMLLSGTFAREATEIRSRRKED